MGKESVDAHKMVLKRIGNSSIHGSAHSPASGTTGSDICARIINRVRWAAGLTGVRDCYPLRTRRTTILTFCRWIPPRPPPSVPTPVRGSISRRTSKCVCDINRARWAARSATGGGSCPPHSNTSSPSTPEKTPHSLTTFNCGVAGPAPWGAGGGNLPERGHAHPVCAAGGAKPHDSNTCGGPRGRCVSSRSGGDTVRGREEATAAPPLRARRRATWISGVGGTEIKGQGGTLPIGAGIAARSSDPRTGKKRGSAAGFIN